MTKEMDERTKSMKPNEVKELHNPDTITMMNEVARLYDQADSKGKPIVMRFGGLLANDEEAHFKVTIERVEL